jgi:hypothetical protein
MSTIPDSIPNSFKCIIMLVFINNKSCKYCPRDAVHKPLQTTHKVRHRWYSFFPICRYYSNSHDLSRRSLNECNLQQLTSEKITAYSGPEAYSEITTHKSGGEDFCSVTKITHSNNLRKADGINTLGGCWKTGIKSLTVYCSCAVLLSYNYFICWLNILSQYTNGIKLKILEY